MSFNKYTELAEGVSRSSSSPVDYVLPPQFNHTITNVINYSKDNYDVLLWVLFLAGVIAFSIIAYFKFHKGHTDI